MAASARHSTARHSTYGDFDAYDEELWPGERVGPPLARTGRKIVLRGIFLLIVLGGGWALYNGRATWPGWSQALIDAVSSAMDRKAPGLAQPTASVTADSIPPARILPAPPTESLSPTLQPLAASRPAATPDATAKSPAPPLTTASLPPAAIGSGDPLPPPAVDPADPYQMRATAAGLHPGLSRVLLTRLSPTDYRNAAHAVQTALAESPDGAVFVWPRQRKPELAVFQVRFVPGAAADCRRYVVTVGKDGWQTTALPMEKCGLRPGRPRRE